MKLVIHTDGGARGNPGPAGIGFTIQTKDGTTLVEIGEYIGEATNNVAEYQALIRALQEAKRLGATAVEVYADSELLVRQIKGEYRVRHQNLIPLYQEVIELTKELSDFSITYIPRTENVRADTLVNWALDEIKKA
ncbi:MAG: ribonuclease HI family protein [bacterium]|jgi:ribonuclease HI